MSSLQCDELGSTIHPSKFFGNNKITSLEGISSLTGNAWERGAETRQASSMRRLYKKKLDNLGNLNMKCASDIKELLLILLAVIHYDYNFLSPYIL